MNLIEVTCPEGTLDEFQRQALAEAIISNLLVEPDAPQQAIERAGRATNVWFHDARIWTSGTGPYLDGAPTPFVVTITVPEAWRDELSRHAIGVVRGFCAGGCRSVYAQDRNIPAMQFVNARPAPNAGYEGGVHA